MVETKKVLKRRNLSKEVLDLRDQLQALTLERDMLKERYECKNCAGTLVRACGRLVCWNCGKVGGK
jgi:hypothetical protein